MVKKSITKRWLLNNLGVVLMILLVIEMTLIYTIQNYYYNSAKQYLVSKINSVKSILSLYAVDESVNFSASTTAIMWENRADVKKLWLLPVLLRI